jgi:hypothetical protein
MVSSGLLRRVALVTTQKTPFFIVTAVKTSNLNFYKLPNYLLMLYRRLITSTVFIPVLSKFSDFHTVYFVYIDV